MVHSETDHEKLFRMGAADIISRLGGLATGSPSSPIVWGLCGGRSPAPLFQILVKKLESLPAGLLKRLRFLQVDERLFGEHNQTSIREQLIDPLVAAGKIAPEQFVPFPLPAERSIELSAPLAAQYEETLRGLGGVFHVVVLGVGEDGHIAGTFPKHPSSAEQKEGFLVYKDSPKPPPGRVTATLPLLARSSFGVLIFTGKSKEEALHRFFSTDLSLAECPAKIVQEMEEFVVLTDRQIPA